MDFKVIGVTDFFCVQVTCAKKASCGCDEGQMEDGKFPPVRVACGI